LGDYQFAKEKDWENKGILALVGIGVEPGMADVFARYAQDHLFDEIEELGIRDGANIEVRGYEFAPNFSIWTTIEECLNPPVIWERGRDWYTTEPFSEPEVFDFPEGIGKVEVVNVEHEEVLLMPRWLNCKRATFKYGLGDQFIGVLKTLHMLGLDNKEKINVKGLQVAPRDVVAACLPDPAHLGEHMFGKTCAGTWVKGLKDGKAREVYLYQVADNEICMQRWGCQAVVAQTAFSAVIAMDLLEHGQWQGVGVLGPEAFPPEPFMDKMADYGFPYGIKEMTPQLVTG
jgi:saccharopine dehydrogenase-like NADP-dependent oxidoreductase